MLDYSVRLTREPWAMQESDVAGLRSVGFADADILDIAQIASYFAYVNRIADGLGVGVEPEKLEEIRAAKDTPRAKDSPQAKNKAQDKE